MPPGLTRQNARPAPDLLPPAQGGTYSHLAEPVVQSGRNATPSPVAPSSSRLVAAITPVHAGRWSRPAAAPRLLEHPAHRRPSGADLHLVEEHGAVAAARRPARRSIAPVNARVVAKQSLASGSGVRAAQLMTPTGAGGADSRRGAPARPAPSRAALTGSSTVASVGRPLDPAHQLPPRVRPMSSLPPRRGEATMSTGHPRGPRWVPWLDASLPGARRPLPPTASAIAVLRT
jgi:hypothetical protein